MSASHPAPAPFDAGESDAIPNVNSPDVTAEAIGTNAARAVSDISGENVGTLDEIGVESRRARLRRIAKPIASFFGVQVIVQVLTLLSGLLLVRTLSKPEYAFYTVANSLQGTIAVLGDSGISSALTAIGGVVWQDRQRFGSLISTALEFRRKFGAAIFVTIGPLLWWLLYSNGATPSYSLLVCALVLAGASLSLVHGVLVVVPRLHARVGQLQKAELVLAGLRLILLGAACLVFIDAAMATGIFVITLSIQNLLYRRWAAADADLKAPSNAADRAEIWKMVRYQAPGGIFYCVQGQISILLIGFFGSTSAIANVGALSRLTIFFSVVSSLMTNLVLPRFARCQTPARLTAMYFQIVGFYLALGCFFMTLVLLAPGPLLWVLGGKYANLGSELAYLTFAGVASAVAGIFYGLNATKGWLKNAWFSIPITVATQLLMLPFLNLGSIKDIALLGAVPALLGALPYPFQAYSHIRALRNSP